MHGITSPMVWPIFCWSMKRQRKPRRRWRLPGWNWKLRRWAEMLWCLSITKKNPVNNLSQQQLVDIYTGRITNWKEVGGEEQDIIAYQRKETSGSQSLFLKLLMQGQQPMEAPQELKPTEMDMLIDELARYNNEGNALGYSVFYYASYMYQQPGLKMLAL